MFFKQIEDMAGVPGLMKPNVEQHAAFHGGLEAFLAYLDAVKAGGEEYDGERLRGIIDSFMPVLRTHLFDEIQTLLALDKYEDKGDWVVLVEKAKEEVHQKMQSDPDLKVRPPRLVVAAQNHAWSKTVADDGCRYYKYTSMPMFMANHDNTYDKDAPSWPPIPWIGKMLMSWVFARRHSTWWRFAPSNISSIPKDMPFV